MDNQKGNLENLAEETVKELLEKMGFTGAVEISKAEEDSRETITCNIKTEESSFLIGQYGVNLQSLQHIARLLIRKKTDDKLNLVLDVNSYRQERDASIINLARAMAEQAVTEKRAVVLRPMSPYERRIVHLELSQNEQVRTESVGEGEDRKVVIKPADLI